MTTQTPITEEWLREMGFRWHEHDRQIHKMWLLWIGNVERPHRMFHGPDDLGIDVSYTGHDDEWFCWLRSDIAGLYHRFIHLRYLRYREELSLLIEALTGQPFKAENNMYGSVHHPDEAAHLRRESDRLDLRMREARKTWFEAENDPSRSAALPEHLDDALNGKKCK